MSVRDVARGGDWGAIDHKNARWAEHQKNRMESRNTHTSLFHHKMVARYLNNDKKGERQISESQVYKVRQTMNHMAHIRGQTRTSL